MGSLRDIEEHWSLTDVLDTIDYLDMIEDADAWNQKKSEE